MSDHEGFDAQAEKEANLMVDTLYVGCEEIMHKLANERLRSHIAHILGPSPFDFRGRHLMSKAEAERIADQVVDAMEKAPDKGQAIFEALYKPEDYWDE
jgi:hypothetical protein